MFPQVCKLQSDLYYSCKTSSSLLLEEVRTDELHLLLSSTISAQVNQHGKVSIFRNDTVELYHLIVGRRVSSVVRYSDKIFSPSSFNLPSNCCVSKSSFRSQSGLTAACLSKEKSHPHADVRAAILAYVRGQSRK